MVTVVILPVKTCFLRALNLLGEPRPSTPTAAELELPWKRNDGDVDVGVKQSEFPPWVENKEYMNYSPSSTFIGNVDLKN